MWSPLYNSWWVVLIKMLLITKCKERIDRPLAGISHVKLKELSLTSTPTNN